MSLFHRPADIGGYGGVPASFGTKDMTYGGYFFGVSELRYLGDVKLDLTPSANVYLDLTPSAIVKLDLTPQSDAREA